MIIYCWFTSTHILQKVLQKVAYIVDAQSQMGNLVLFDENPMQTFVVDVLKVMLFGNKEFYLSPAFYFAVIIALNSSKSTWLSPLTSAWWRKCSAERYQSPHHQPRASFLASRRRWNGLRGLPWQPWSRCLMQTHSCPCQTLRGRILSQQCWI